MRADHSSSRSGWALGEQAMYCKMANFELQTRVPMMVRAPWLKSTGSTTALAELVDMCAEPLLSPQPFRHLPVHCLIFVSVAQGTRRPSS